MAEDLEVPLDEESDFTSSVFPTEPVGRWAFFPLFSSWSWRLVPPSVSSVAGWPSFSSVWWSTGDSLFPVLGGLSLLVFKLGGCSWKVDGKRWIVELLGNHCMAGTMFLSWAPRWDGHRLLSPSSFLSIYPMDSRYCGRLWSLFNPDPMLGSQRLWPNRQQQHHVRRCRSKRPLHRVGPFFSGSDVADVSIIEFPSMPEAEDAIARLTGQEIRGIPVKLELAPVSYNSSVTWA
jgi:hypothetical protein